MPPNKKRPFLEYLTDKAFSDSTVRWLLRHLGFSLKSGTRFSWRWSRDEREGASIGAFAYRDKVVFSYRHHSGLGGEWKNLEEPIPLKWTPCNFGGERPWFVCPGVVNGVACGRRVAILYGPGKYFLCRLC